MSQPVKSEVIAQYKTHEKDTGSSDVQIALLTARINHLTEHLRTHRKDFHSRRGLLQMASRRRKLLDYVKSEDLAKYNDLLQKLSLRKYPVSREAAHRRAAFCSTPREADPRDISVYFSPRWNALTPARFPKAS